MNKYRILRIGVTISLLLAFAGCGKNVVVRGKVTFPDGTPLTVGHVAFENDVYVATGVLKSDGTYVMGSEKKEGGMLPGTYRIAVRGAYEAPEGDPTVQGAPQPKPLIDAKFEEGETSGLTCEVKGSTTFDIQVTASK